MGESGITASIPAPTVAAVGRDPSVQTQPQALGQQLPAGTAAGTSETPAPPIDPAVALAGRLAHLLTGQRLSGSVTGKDGDGHTLLKTVVGTFAVDPSSALPAEGEAEILITRADRETSALIVSHGGQAVEPPVPVRLTLVTLAVEDTSVPADTAGSLADGLARAIKALPEAVRASLASAPAVVALEEAPGLPLPPRTIPAPVQAPTAPAPTGSRFEAVVPVATQTAWQAATDLRLTPLPDAPAETVFLSAPKPAPAPAPVPVMVIAIVPDAQATPLSQPPAGSPVAALHASGRMSTWTVVAAADDRTLTAPVPAGHVMVENAGTGQRAILKAPTPLPPGTPLVLMVTAASVPPDLAPPADTFKSAVESAQMPAKRRVWPDPQAPVGLPIAPAATQTRPAAPPAHGDQRGLAKFLRSALGLGEVLPGADPGLADATAAPSSEPALNKTLARGGPASGAGEQAADTRTQTILIKVDGQVPLPAYVQFEQPAPWREEARKSAAGAINERRFSISVDYPRIGRLRLDGRLSGNSLHAMVHTRMALPEPLMLSAQALYRQVLEGAGLAGSLHFS